MLRKILGIQQEKFLFNAFLVWGISQITLHTLLLIFNIAISTIASSICYIFLGFYFYGKNVFSIKKFSKVSFFKFLMMANILWIINFCGIYILNNFLNQKNLSALLMIPFLAIISFLIQKHFVFK